MFHQKNKISQISFFIIIGFILFLLVVVLTFSNSSEKQSSLDTSPLTMDISPIKSFVESCTYDEMRLGLRYTGYDNIGNFGNYINSKVPSCYGDFSNFPEFNITKSNFKSQMKITSNDDSIINNVDFLLNINKDDKSSSIQDYKVEFLLKNEIEIEYSGGKVKRDYILRSTDGYYKLKIKKDTIITSNSGSLPNKVELSILNAEPYKAFDIYIIGEIIYSINPEGLEFNPPLELEYNYDTSLIPSRIHEKNLSVSFIDEYDIWQNHYNVDIDTSKKLLKAEISFSGLSAITDKRCRVYVDGIEGYYSGLPPPDESYMLMYKYKKPGYNYCSSGDCNVVLDCGANYNFPKPLGGTQCPTERGESGRYQSGSFIWKGRSEGCRITGCCNLVLILPQKYASGEAGE